MDKKKATPTEVKSSPRRVDYTTSLHDGITNAMSSPVLQSVAVLVVMIMTIAGGAL